MSYLETRDKGTDRIRGMILFSITLHVIVLALTLWSPLQTKPKWTFGPVYSVALVSLPTGQQRSAAAGIKEIMPSVAPRHPAIALRKPIEMTSAEPLKRVEVPRKQREDTLKISDELRARAAASALPSGTGTARTTAKEQTTAAGAGISAEASVVSSAGSEAEINQRIQSYYMQIWSRIKGQWTIPPSLMPKENMSNTIIVKIARNGTVTELSFERKSGHTHFDESALRAIRKASPFPPLPDWMSNKEIELGIRFHSSELR